jgi:hypothetical protein
MGFPLIDRAATELGRAFQGKYSGMGQLIPANPVIAHFG